MVRLALVLIPLIGVLIAARPASQQSPPPDGAIPEDRPLSPFDADDVAIARLDPALRSAVQRAARDARRDGITVRITSGWRSRSYQRELLDEAIVTYGSEAVARRYVATPEISEHVTGDAVDVGPTDAAYWMIQHGARYGLCQTYANEVWHFERVVGACPTPRPDASR